MIKRIIPMAIAVAGMVSCGGGTDFDPASVSDAGKPRISKKMRAMLKNSGQKQINIKELMQNVQPKEPEEVRAIVSNEK